MKPEATPEELGRRLDRLLSRELSDVALLAELEPLSRERRFGALTPRFGPALYSRNRAMFRPFILAHFSSFDVGARVWTQLGWAAHAKALDPWLEAVDAADDVELFRRLWEWKFPGDAKRWRAELVRRFAAAPDAAARRVVIDKLESHHPLDEDAALALVKVDREAARPLLLAQLPRVFGRWRKEKPWRRLAAAIEGDEELRFALYRAHTEPAEWLEDARRLVRDRALPDERVVAELERRHVAKGGLGPVLLELVEQRGRGGLPYVFAHLGELTRWVRADRAVAKKLVARASKEGWLDLWGALVRATSDQAEYDAEVKALLSDRRQSDAELTARLLVLAGASREWNVPGWGLAQVMPLSDEVAVLFYHRYPKILSRHFLPNLSWWTGYPKLVSALVEAEDTELLDFLASRMVTRVLGPHTGAAKETVELLAAYYEGLKNTPAGMVARAASVLNRVPAYSIHAYDAVLRDNRLARLLFERSLSDVLLDATAVRDLLEAPEIHVQRLALRALGLDTPRARELAAENRDLLEATLLRKLHRRTRVEAFAALANAASDAESARRIVRKAKEAFALPDRRYPKEPLIGMIAQILHRFPEARGPGEAPTIFREARA